MELVCAALGDQVDYAAGNSAELRLVAVRLNFELTQRVDIGRNRVRSAVIAVVINTIQRKRIATVSLSVDGRKIGLAHFRHEERRVIFAYTDRRRPGGESDELGKV